MMLTTLIGAALIAFGPTPTTTVRPAADIIEIRAGMFDGAEGIRRDQIRYSNDTKGVVVAEMGQDGRVNWNAPSDRERLGGHDAPSLIYVRVFDGVFAIDPFVVMPVGDITAMRALFMGSSLETDRALFGRRQIERTKELFERLEYARKSWLRENGYYLPRTVTRTNASATAANSRTNIEPVMKFERPVDMPRGRSFEEVNATPVIDSTTTVSRSLLDTDEPIRISMPMGTAADVVAEAESKTSEPTEDEESSTEIAAK
ncbi:MAG: hypothetical protein JKY96_02495 [Phycisphaerales bacterium]|nr:hypothetical protein [Phycisphaerales bacterium]